MMNHIKLLTPELIAKVDSKMRECFKVAQEKYGVTFQVPEVRYDIKNHTGGLAYRDRQLIRFNLILLVENEKHYLETTVPHEVAHMIVNGLFAAKKFKLAKGKKKWMPHGAEWKEVMSVLNVTPSVKHTYDCSSIEKSSRAKRTGKISRVDRIFNQIRRLTQGEIGDLVYQIKGI